ncbi:MAG: single-stranded DNA-binding protein [Fimbriimonadales bacterium]|nr:single-stranded DNA-binding protein [Fimbriimonadales bacterium]
MVNRVVLVGRLTRDPEVRSTTTGKTVCDFSIAVDRRVASQDGQDADFFRVTAWGQTAEFVSRYLSKGRLVAVDGRLQWRKYTDSQGITREAVEVVAESVQGLDRPREHGSDSESGAARRERGPSAPPAATDPFAGPSPSAPGKQTAPAVEPDEDEYDPFADGSN